MADTHVLTTRPWRKPQSLSSVPYLPGLDGVRALAVVAVIVYHANSAWLPGGFLGVEVFFVVSGYLITLLLMAETERTGRVDLVAFWGRRARRLLPALYATLLGVLVYTTFLRPDRLGEIRGDVVAAFFYVSNWYQIWVGKGYTATGDFAPLRHLWSLAVEEQFYVVWPMVMVLMLRRGTRRLANAAPWLFGGAIVMAIATAVLFYGGQIDSCANTPAAYWRIAGRCISKDDALYLSTISRATGLMLGAGFAMIWRPVAIMRGPLRNANRALDAAAVFALIGLGLMTWWVHFIYAGVADPWLFRGGFFLVDVLTLVVIAAVTHRYALSGRLLGNPVFLWVGTRSYGLYLFHWPIFQVIRGVAGRPLTIVEFAIAMPITLVITELSYRFLETPIRKREVAAWWRRMRRQGDPVPRNIAMALIVLLIAVGSWSSVKLFAAPLIPNALAADQAANEDSTSSFQDILGTDTTNVTAVPITTPTTAPPASASVVPASTSSTTTTTTTTLPSEPVDYLAIGDSVMLGAADRLKEHGWTVVAAQNRQMEDVVPFLNALKERDLLGSPIFIHLGTNGPITPEVLNELLAPLKNVPVVVLYNVKGNVPWRDANNKIFADKDVPGDNIILVDWNERSLECTGNCYAGDGIHLSADGKKFYTDLVDSIVFG